MYRTVFRASEKHAFRDVPGKAEDRLREKESGEKGFGRDVPQLETSGSTSSEREWQRTLTEWSFDEVRTLHVGKRPTPQIISVTGRV